MSNKEEAIKCYLDGLLEATKAFIKHQNLFIFYLNVEQAKLQASIILSQPKSPAGGMVVHPNIGGDVIGLSNGSNIIISNNGEALFSLEKTDFTIVDTREPGGDRS